MFDGENLCFDGFSDVVSATVDDDHGAVVEVSDALARLFSVALHFDGNVFAGFHEWFHGVGHGV